MQTNSTQIARAIAQLYVLSGSFDAPGVTCVFKPCLSPMSKVGRLLPAGQRALTLGLLERPLGPSRWQFVTSNELYKGILEQQPYAVHGTVGFGANLLLAHAEGLLGREALAALDFYVHADLFMNPTAELADIVLPVASAFERGSPQDRLRGEPGGAIASAAAPARCRATGRGPLRHQIVFDLARRLGLGAHFWDGDIEAAYRYQLGPSGLSLEVLRQQPGGCERWYTRATASSPNGRTGSSRALTPPREDRAVLSDPAGARLPPLPEYEEPLVSPVSRPDLASRYPLISPAPSTRCFAKSQHRGLRACGGRRWIRKSRSTLRRLPSGASTLVTG